MESHPRSLSKDRNDLTSLHSPKWREELDSTVTGLGEPNPFFYTRNGAALPLEGMYRGGHAFLMANGPSVLNHEQPEEMTLGELRNMALDLVVGEWVIQWDDDDLELYCRFDHGANTWHMGHIMKPRGKNIALKPELHHLLEKTILPLYCPQSSESD